MEQIIINVSIIENILYMGIGLCSGVLIGSFYMWCSIRRRWPQCKKIIDKT